MAKLCAQFTLRSLSVVIAAFMALISPAHAISTSIVVEESSDSGLTATQLLNRRRTDITLFLFAPVLADMVNQGERESQGWMARIRQRLDSKFDPAKLFEERHQCLNILVTEWQARSATGQFATSRELLKDVFTSQKKASPTCAAWLKLIVGEKTQDEVHGAYLHALMQAEMKFSLHEQKQSHLAALSVLTTKSATQYYQAAKDVALFYMDDTNQEIREIAQNWIRRLPKMQTGRQILDLVRPDILMSGFVMASGGVRLINHLGAVAPSAVVASRVQGASISLGLHLGVLSAATADLNSLGPQTRRRFAIRGDKAAEIPAIETDPFPDSILQSYAEQVPQRIKKILGRHYYLSTNFDLISFLMMSQGNAEKGSDPFIVERQIQGLKALSNDIRSDLSDKRLSFVERIDLARARVLSNEFATAYVKKQPGLLQFVRGEGGNCLAQTQLLLALLYPHRDLLEDGWELGLEILPYHIQAVLWNSKTKNVIDLWTGDLSDKIANGIYHPLVLAEGYLRYVKKLATSGEASALAWRPYLLGWPDKLTDQEIEHQLSLDIVSTGSGNLRLKLPPLVNLTGLGEEPAIPERAKVKFQPTARRKRSVSQRVGDSTKSADLFPIKHIQVFSPRDAHVEDYLQGQKHASFYLNGKEKSFTLTFRLDADREKYESLSTPSQRSLFLDQLVIRDANDRYVAALKIKDSLEEPLKAIKGLGAGPYEEGYAIELVNYAFDFSTLTAKLSEVEMLRAVEKVAVAKVYDARAQEIKFETVPELRRLFELQLGILKALGQNPEAVAAIIDDKRVWSSNKTILRTTIAFIGSSFSGTDSKSPASRYSAESLKALKSFSEALANPRRIEMASSANNLQPPKLLPSIKVGARMTSDLEIKDLKDLKRVSPEACPGADTSGRCRQQEITWINTKGSQVYVSPATFVSLYLGMLGFARDQNKTEIVSMLFRRWDANFDRAMAQVYLRSFKQENADTLFDGIDEIIRTFDGAALEYEVSSALLPEISTSKMSKLPYGKIILDRSSKKLDLNSSVAVRATPKFAALYACRPKAKVTARNWPGVKNCIDKLL